MLRLTLAVLALAVIGGAARAECYYYPNGAVFCPTAGGPFGSLPSPGADPALLADIGSGAMAARVQQQQLQNEILRLQLQQMRQR